MLLHLPVARGSHICVCPETSTGGFDSFGLFFFHVSDMKVGYRQQDELS